MNNFVQQGDIVTVTAAGKSSGDMVRVGHLFGVAQTDTDSVDGTVPIKTTGVFSLTKATGETWAEGDVVYYDEVDDQLSLFGGQFRAGVVTEDAASSATTGNVRLDGQGAKPGTEVTLVHEFDATGGKAVGTHDLSGPLLPDNFTAHRTKYEVLTTFTDGVSDAATIALGIETDDVAGIVAATAISGGGNIWDAGWHEGIQDGTVANASVKTTAKGRAIQAVVAGVDLTAGKLLLFTTGVITE